jgi:tousled-like kinase
MEYRLAEEQAKNASLEEHAAQMARTLQEQREVANRLARQVRASDDETRRLQELVDLQRQSDFAFLRQQVALVADCERQAALDRASAQMAQLGVPRPSRRCPAGYEFSECPEERRLRSELRRLEQDVTKLRALLPASAATHRSGSGPDAHLVAATGVSSVFGDASQPEYMKAAAADVACGHEPEPFARRLFDVLLPPEQALQRQADLAPMAISSRPPKDQLELRVEYDSALRLRERAVREREDKINALRVRLSALKTEQHDFLADYLRLEAERRCRFHMFPALPLPRSLSSTGPTRVPSAARVDQDASRLAEASRMGGDTDAYALSSGPGGDNRYSYLGTGESTRPGRYQLLKLLGKGGFSEVYEAFDLELKVRCALKVHVIRAEWDENRKQQYVKKALRELGIQLAVSHPNVVTCLNYFELDDTAFVSVLQYCGGGDLHTLLRRSRLSEDDARPIFVQMCLGLRYLHAPDADRPAVVHYDVKPANLLFTESGEVRLTDFGLSKRVPEGQEAIHQTSLGAGTPGYLAPEGYNCIEVTPAVDIFAAGIVLYVMLFGKTPYTEAQLRSASRTRPIVTAPDPTLTQDSSPPSVDFAYHLPELTVSPNVPLSDECHVLLRKLLRANPSERPTVLEVLSDPWVVAPSKTNAPKRKRKAPPKS